MTPRRLSAISRLLALGTALAGLASSVSGQDCQWVWEPIGADGDVWALFTYDDGSGPAVYAGGWFGTIGGVYSPYLARFDGRDWAPVGGGVVGSVRAFGVHDDGAGPALHIGGGIKNAGGIPVSHVARWDGKMWGSVGDGIKESEDTVLCLASIPGPRGATLYAGGYFNYAGGKDVQSVAQLVDGHWTAMDGGVFGAPYALTSFDAGSDPMLFTGGSFTKAGGKPIKTLAAWDGATWSDPGALFSYPSKVWAMLPRVEAGQAVLYVGGGMDMSGDLVVNGICRWDGQDWSALGSGVTDAGAVFALAEYRASATNLLIAAGGFPEAGGIPARNIAAWDGQSWSAIGEGVGNNYVWSLATADFGDGPILFVGGWFEEAGGLDSPNLAMVRCIPVCMADCDSSGTIDLADFACFQSSFAAGDLKADCDGNAALDLFDFLCFLNAFNEGCP